VKKVEKTKKAARLSLLIIFLSIIGLILVSLLPWISVAEDGAVKQNLHFNYEMMQKSNNKQIKNLTTNLYIINISFWILTILGIISFIGVTIYASNVDSRIGLILLASYCASLIFSILIVFLNWIIIKTVEESNTISASTIIFTPIKYAYIPLVVGILLLISSIRYTWVILPYSIKELKSLPKEKKYTEKQVDNKNIKTETITKIEKSALEQTLQEPKIDEERGEIEEWLTGEVQNIEKQAVKGRYLESEKEKQIELEKITAPEQPFLEEEPLDIEEKKPEKSTQAKEKIFKEPYKKSKETPFMDYNNRLEPFSPEKKEEKIKGLDDVGLTHSFEEALSSAIQKRHIETNMKDIIKTEVKDIKDKSNVISKEDKVETPMLKIQNEEIMQTKEEISPQINEKPIKKINVKCPQCKHITTIEKGEIITKIKCPNCGKEGVVK
jgi:ribosomal protein S27E